MKNEEVAAQTKRNSRAPKPFQSELNKSVAPKPVTFELKADPGSDVRLAGSFNNWDPSEHPLKEKEGVFSTTVRLNPGQHEYKFVVNGTWCADPNCEEWVPNGVGSINSVLKMS